jgi:predicted transglutaminase-like cysteine proteinase
VIGTISAPTASPVSAYASLVRRSPLIVDPIASDRPNVFGSVALRVGRTSLDRRWRKVAGERIAGTPAAAFAASLRDAGEAERADSINRYVNGRVTFVDDARQYGQSDLWSAASDTLRRGRGDCEDYAIAKLQMLRAAGVSDRDLYLVVVKDLVRRADHAVLVVRAGGRLLLLDNGTDVVTDASKAVDYRPILTFSATGTWTHGYRRHTPPVQIAAASIPPLSPAVGPSTAE